MLQSLLPEAIEGVMVFGAGWLLTYLLHSTVLLGIAWCLDRWSGISASPRLRSWLWRAALVGGVATATLASLGWSPSAVELSVTEAEKAVLELPTAGGSPSAQPVAPDAAPSPGESYSRPESAAPPAARFTSPHRSDLTNPVAWWAAASHDWPYLLFLASVAVAAAVLLGRGLRLWSFFRHLGSRQPVESGPLREALDDLVDDPLDAREVALSLSGTLASPVTLPGGEICVPSRAREELDDREMKALLAHELTHLRRRDPPTLLALAALEGLLAVQPLNRVARRRLVSAAESRIDDHVRRLGLGTALASTIVTVGRWMRGGRAQGHVAGLARDSELETRVRRLLDGPDMSEEAGAPGAAPFVAGAAVVLGAITLLSPAARMSPTPHPPHLGHGSADIARETLRCDSPFAGISVPGGEDCSSEAGPGAAARRELAEGDGVGLYVEVDAPDRELRLRLRPGGASVRWHASSGRQLALPMPRTDWEPEGTVATLRVSARDGEEHVLYLPPSVRRLMVVVNGRIVTGDRLPTGGDLPRLVTPKEEKQPRSS